MYLTRIWPEIKNIFVNMYEIELATVNCTESGMWLINLFLGQLLLTQSYETLVSHESDILKGWASFNCLQYIFQFDMITVLFLTWILPLIENKFLQSYPHSFADSDDSTVFYAERPVNCATSLAWQRVVKAQKVFNLLKWCRR